MLVEIGSVFDVVCDVYEPDPAPVTLDVPYNLVLVNNLTVPAAGQVTHAQNAAEILRFNKIDDLGTDRGAALVALTAGDIIDSGDTRYGIQSVTDNGSYVSFLVSPATRDTGGLRTYTLETTASTTITYPREVDAWLSDPNVQGLFIQDGAYSNIVPDNHAYGLDVSIQEASVSDDWDTLATSSGASAGDSDGGGEAVWGTILGDIDAQDDLRLEFLTKEPLIDPKFTAFNKDFGTNSDTVCEGNDSRLSDARPPTAHDHDDLYYTKTEANTLYNNALKYNGLLPPSNPVDGEEWMDISTMNEYTWYSQGQGQWVRNETQLG